MNALKRPWFRSQRAALVVGLVAMGVGWKALYDAYEGRGRKEPLIIRPLKPW